MSGIIALLVFFISMAVIIFLTARYKFNAALVLIGVSILSGIIIVQQTSEIVSTIRNGFGLTLGYTGLVIIEGIVISTILGKSGILKSLAEGIIKFTGFDRSVLAVSITGYAVSIPVSCDSGFIALSGLSETMAGITGKPLAVMTVALSTGLYVTHCLVPPTPGPVGSIGILNANPFIVTLLGIIVSIPGMMAGYLWAVKYAAKLEIIPVFDNISENNNTKETAVWSGFSKYLPLLFPVLLMAFRASAMVPSRPFGGGVIYKFFVFTGDPVLSLFIGIIAALIIAGKKYTAAELNEWCTEGVKRSAPILIAAGAGGAFGAVIKASSLINASVGTMSGWHIGIFLPFIIAAVLKTLTGSSTVSIITTSSVIAPLTTQLGIHPALAVLAVGSGSMLVSHVNDPFFWIVSKFGGMDTSTALRIFTPATAITGVVTFVFVAILSVFIR
jgi:GntP family gluconate:H+ symporter